MTFLESIGLVNPPPADKVVAQFVSEQKEKKSGTLEYKNGLVYIYCDVVDRDRAKALAKELNIPMKVLIHRLLFAAEIAIPSKTKVSVLNGKQFWEMFPGIEE